MFYFDADDNTVNDDLYENVRDLECAFAKTRNTDGTTKEGYPSITALVLWDGISEEKKGDQNFIHPDGALYEIGADYTLEYEPIEGNEYGAVSINYRESFAIGANTKDLTAQAADWLPKEPDMSDPATFTNFLKWAKARYTAENVVVCLQDHGSGTYKETYTDSRDKTTSRVLCVDATPGTNRLLTCKNITDALTEAGYTGKDKPKILWNDLCLQATAEIVWNYKGCADYYCASPNVSSMPDYYGVFTNIKSNMTALDVGKVIVSAYFQKNYDTVIPLPTEPTAASIARASACSMYTSSFISLDTQKVEAMKTAVDNLAAALLDLNKKNKELFMEIFLRYISQDPQATEKCKGLTYVGTYAWLNDIGWFCEELCADEALPAAVRESADALKKVLANGDDKLIIYAWGGKRAIKEKTTSIGWDEEQIPKKQLYLTGQKDFISNWSVVTEKESSCYGLTIVGSVWIIENVEEDLIKNYEDWTGFSENWGKVLRAWN